MAAGGGGDPFQNNGAMGGFRLGNAQFIAAADPRDDSQYEAGSHSNINGIEWGQVSFPPRSAFPEDGSSLGAVGGMDWGMGGSSSSVPNATQHSWSNRGVAGSDATMMPQTAANVMDDDMDISAQMESLTLATAAANSNNNNNQGWPSLFGGVPGSQDNGGYCYSQGSSDKSSGSSEPEPPFDSPPKLERIRCPVTGYFLGFEDADGLSVLIENHYIHDRYTYLFELIDHWAPRSGNIIRWETLKPGQSHVIAKLEHALPDGNVQTKCIRGRVVAKDEQRKEVTVRNCDTWVRPHAVVAAHQVLWMTPEFKRLPFKITTCKISGFENWSYSALCKELLGFSSLDVNNKFTITHCSVSQDGKYLVIDGVFPHVTVAGEEHDNVLLSALLKHLLSRMTRVPKVFKPGLLIDFFHVVFIEDNGSGRLLFTMHTTLDNRLCYDKPPGRQFDPTRADDPDLNPSNDRPKFLSRTRMFGLNDPSYYRVRVLEYPKPDGKVKVQFVDFGNTEDVSYAEMIPTALVDPILESIIPQIFVGRLNGIAQIRNIEQFFNVLGGTVPQRGIVTEVDVDGIPFIDLYAKCEDWTEWSYINSQLLQSGLGMPNGLLNVYPFDTEVPEEERIRNQYVGSMNIVGTNDTTVNQLLRYDRSYFVP